MKELLLKGENLQKRVPDQDKREQIRLKHNQLNSKYNTVKVTYTLSEPSDLSMKEMSQAMRQTVFILKAGGHTGGFLDWFTRTCLSLQSERK